MNFSKAEFVLHYTDGSEVRFPASLAEKEQTFSDGSTFVSVRQCGREYETALSAKAPKAVRYADWELFIPDAFLQGDIRVFYNGYTTNDPAAIASHQGLIGANTRDIVLFNRYGTDETIGAGFTSVNRFWTYIKIAADRVILRHWMEDKPLTQGEEYRLERVLLGQGTAEEQLEEYAARMAERYARPKREIPTGWCSWSCYYKNVDEEKLFRANRELDTIYAEQKTNLVQIDDGWQQGNSFCGTWLEDREKYPQGLAAVAEECRRSGRTFGLWLAPMIACEDSELFLEQPELKKVMRCEGQPDEAYHFIDTSVFSLDLGKKEALEHLQRVFERCSKEYGSNYYKLDFLIFALHKLADREYMLSYEGDYVTAVYRRAMQTIRDTIGEEAFMLACGAPISESAGIFDAIRVTPDITWGKNKANPKQWDLISMCTRSILYRYFYNGSLFINDPDGLVVRDFDYDDGYDCTYQEARAWATSVAMSGGSVLINEQMEKIGPSRREMFEQLLPPLGIAARPVDFFELPQPSRAYIRLENGAVLAALYNWSNEIEDITLCLEKVGVRGDAVAMRTWGKQLCGLCRGEITVQAMMPHSAEVLYIAPIGERPSFAFAECNLYGGAGLFEEKYEGDELCISISQELDSCKNRTYYIYVPQGFKAENGEQAMQVEQGTLLRMEAAPGCAQRIRFRRV